MFFNNISKECRKKIVTEAQTGNNRTLPKRFRFFIPKKPIDFSTLLKTVNAQQLIEYFRNKEHKK